MRSPFEGLAPRTRRWVTYEQTLNERLIDRRRYAPIDRRSHTVLPHLCPERRPVWDQAVTWLPRDRVRIYGPLQHELWAAFGLDRHDARSPIFLHPQAPAAQRRLAQTHGCELLPEVSCTPTASYRSVVAWHRDAAKDPVILKLSLGAIIGRRRRHLTELYVAQAIVMSAVLETIPVAERQRLHVDWFSEPCGAVEVNSRQGWLLRRLPPFMTETGTSTMMPVFSLISQQAGREPLLVRIIRRSGRAAEDFVIDRLIRPYVSVEAHLLFEHGVQHEGHTQNVLVEVDAHQRLKRRLILRDFSDTSINIAFRMARGKPLPRFAQGLLPRRTPFSIAGNVGDHHTNFRRPRIQRGFDTVEHYGLGGFVWPINASLRRFFRGYDAALVERVYLELWQQAAIESLKVRPLFRAKPKGLATDEAVAYFLRHLTDWRALGARPASLPDTAEPLLGEGRQQRRAGRVYDRLSNAWGDLFMSNGHPAFFRPAF